MENSIKNSSNFSNSEELRKKSNLKSLAQKIVNLKLEMPVIFFLEANKPLTTIAYQSLNALMPFFQASPSRTTSRTTFRQSSALDAEQNETLQKSSILQTLQYILEDRKNVEELINLINQYSKQAK